MCVCVCVCVCLDFSLDLSLSLCPCVRVKEMGVVKATQQHKRTWSVRLECICQPQLAPAVVAGACVHACPQETTEAFRPDGKKVSE